VPRLPGDRFLVVISHGVTGTTSGVKTDHPGLITDQLVALGTCWLCEATITFEPKRVPSLLIDPVTDTLPDVGGAPNRAVRHPVCLRCVKRANEARAAIGAPPIYVPPDAYFALV